MKWRGTCFGFEIHSTLPFRFLRAAPGDALEVVTHTESAPTPTDELVVEWKQRPGRPFHGRVYQDDSRRYRLWTSDANWFLVDPIANRIAVEEGVDALRREVRLLTTPMLLLMVERGDLPLHASAVEVDGRALLFGAPSRFGKTTMAAGFHAAGHRVLAEDVSCVCLGDEAAVLPGPALLRLRHDMVERLPLERVRNVGDDPERAFLALENAQAGGGEPVPLAGLVLLRGHASEVRLKAASSPELLRDLWALGFKLPTDADFQRCFDGLAKLHERVPIWNLHYPMEIDQLPAVVEELAERLRP